MRFAFLTILVTLSVPSLASADILAAGQARTILLKDHSAVVFYSQTPAGFEVITTVAATEAETDPVRLLNTLTDAQSVTVEVAGPAGTPADRLILSRVGDYLRVERSPQQTAARP
jgi:hypothetical protein